MVLQDSDKPKQLTRNAAQNIVNGRWSMPDDVQVSQNCLDLLNAIFTKEAKVQLPVFYSACRCHAADSNQLSAGSIQSVVLEHDCMVLFKASSIHKLVPPGMQTLGHLVRACSRQAATTAGHIHWTHHYQQRNCFYAWSMRRCYSTCTLYHWPICAGAHRCRGHQAACVVHSSAPAACCKDTLAAREAECDRNSRNNRACSQASH